jgi:hypothetical protein
MADFQVIAPDTTPLPSSMSLLPSRWHEYPAAQNPKHAGIQPLAVAAWALKFVRRAAEWLDNPPVRFTMNQSYDAKCAREEERDAGADAGMAAAVP